MPEVFKKRFQFNCKPSQDPSRLIAETLNSWILEKWANVPVLLGSSPQRSNGPYGSILWRPFNDNKGWIHEFIWRQENLKSGIKWQTIICAYSKFDNNFIEITISNNGPDRHEPNAQLTSRPRFLLKLIESVKIWSEDCPMDSTPIGKSSDEIRDFVRYDLLDKTRKFPIIVVSQKSDGYFSMEFDPARLANESLSLGKVYFLKDQDASWALTKELGGSELSAFDGATRCYLPGFNLKANPFEHPLFFPGKFSAPTRQRLWEWLSANTVQWHIPDSFLEDRKLERDYHESSQRRELIEENRKAFEVAKDKDDFQRLAEGYAADNTQLLEDLEELREESKQLKEEAKQLKHKNQLLLTALETKNPGQIVSGFNVPYQAQSVFEAVDNAAKIFSKHLIFCPKAFKSAEESPYDHPHKVSEIFRAMAEIARESEAGSLGKGLKELFSANGLIYKANIGESTSKKLREQYKISDGKNEYDCIEHIRLGSTYDATECLVVYFHSQLKSNKFIIGHVGVHFENMTST